MEQQLPTGLAEWQVAEFIDDDEIVAQQLLGETSTASGGLLLFELVDQIDEVEEAAPGARSDDGCGYADAEMGLAGAGRSRATMPATTMVTIGYAIDSILFLVKPLSLPRASGTAVTFS